MKYVNVQLMGSTTRHDEQTPIKKGDRYVHNILFRTRSEIQNGVLWYWQTFKIQTCILDITPLYLSSRVRVRSSVATPKYKWGSVSHQSIGVVLEVITTKQDVYVDFPEQKKWTGHISEMEKVQTYYPSPD